MPRKNSTSKPTKAYEKVMPVQHLLVVARATFKNAQRQTNEQKYHCYFVNVYASLAVKTSGLKTKVKNIRV